MKKYFLNDFLNNDSIKDFTHAIYNSDSKIYIQCLEKALLTKVILKSDINRKFTTVKEIFDYIHSNENSLGILNLDYAIKGILFIETLINITLSSPDNTKLFLKNGYIPTIVLEGNGLMSFEDRAFSIHGKLNNNAINRCFYDLYLKAISNNISMNFDRGVLYISDEKIVFSIDNNIIFNIILIPNDIYECLLGVTEIHDFILRYDSIAPLLNIKKRLTDNLFEECIEFIDISFSKYKEDDICNCIGIVLNILSIMDSDEIFSKIYNHYGIIRSYYECIYEEFMESLRFTDCISYFNKTNDVILSYERYKMTSLIYKTFIDKFNSEL